MDELLKETSRRIQLALKRAGLSQKELVAKTGINKASVSQYCTGRNIPLKENAKKIADVLGVDYLWLMGLKNEDDTQNEFMSTVKELKNDRQIKNVIMKYGTLSESERAALWDTIRKIVE
jgi:transcriptional regulator with XRE-family HTH domain